MEHIQSTSTLLYEVLVFLSVNFNYLIKNYDVEVIGISISEMCEVKRVYKLINVLLKLLMLTKIEFEDVIVIDDYVFGVYTVIAKDVGKTIKLIARRE